MYNHHQTGPAGTVMFTPPFRDPFNYNFDPLVPLGIDLVGAAMHSRLVAEGKRGVTMRSGSNYSTWWNGGLRTVAYFHNMIGMLTEIIGNPTPMTIPLVPEQAAAAGRLAAADRAAEVALPPVDRLLDHDQPRDARLRIALPRDVALQHLRDGAELDRAGQPGQLDGHAEDGSRRWRQRRRGAGDDSGRAMHRRRGRRTRHSAAERAAGRALQYRAARSEDARSARLHPPGRPGGLRQRRRSSSNALLKNGITVHPRDRAVQRRRQGVSRGLVRGEDGAGVPAARASTCSSRRIIRTTSRIRAGRRFRPYDNAGWTLAFQMGVKFDRILDGFDGPFTKVSGLLPPPAAAVTGPVNPAGYLISHQINNSFIVVNRLLKRNAEVYWLKRDEALDGEDLGTGGIWVPASDRARAVLEDGAKELGVTVHAVAKSPRGDALKLRPVRIGLYDQYGGLLPAGWTRWLFEQYELPFQMVYSADIDAGDLRARFDVLVFVAGAIRGRGTGGATGRRGERGSMCRQKYRGWVGQISADKIAAADQEVCRVRRVRS